MISPFLSLALATLYTQSFYLEDRDWEGSTHSATNSIEVTGTQTYYKLTTPQSEYVAPPETAKNTDSMVEDTIAASVGVFFRKELKKSELVTINDIARLNVDGGNISIQPVRGWAYVNKPVYLHSDTRPITQQTTILGSDVTITVTPSSYTWNCGDGNSFTTQDAGGTWSQGGKVTCSYTRAGTYTISVDTLWQAQYTVGGKTYPVTGTLTTTSTAQQIRIVEAEAVLKN